MKVRGDIEVVNLETGERWQRVSGDGESVLRKVWQAKQSDAGSRLADPRQGPAIEPDEICEADKRGNL